MTPAEELRFHLREAHRSLSEPQGRIRFPHHGNFFSEPTFDRPPPTGAHFHLRAELFLQRAASTRFVFPTETLLLRPNEVLIVPSRVYHAEFIVAEPKEDSFRNVVLYADEGTLSCHLADQGPTGGPRIAYPEHLESESCGRVAAWLEDTVRISREEKGPTDVAADLVRSILGMTLKLLDLPSARKTEEPLTVVRCRRMIHESLGNPDLSVASLARRLGCTADYLSHLFTTVRGERLTGYIEGLRMVRAAELLIKTSLSCKEVAWASGYANQSYFIRCFRKRWGDSPTAYRQDRLGSFLSRRARQ